MKIVVALRDLRTSPCKLIVEAEREIDEDLSGLDDEPSDYAQEPGAFEDFIREVRKILPIKEQKVDVYIGWWGSQGTFIIPQEFFQIIAETKWPVTFDIND
jgi:hypothetical protein